MKTIKYLKKFILIILIISINTTSLEVFANPTNEGSRIYKNESTILDGEIGEWDPTLQDKPNFKQGNLEIDGKIPEKDEYYTISVTVPLKMEFFVVSSKHMSMGGFLSPLYTIKNNGSKKISVYLDSFTTNGVEDKNTTPLYVEKLSDDDRTQIELKMHGIDDLYWQSIEKTIDLTELDSLQHQDKKIYDLQANEVKGIKFDSDKWELPQNECGKEKALSNFSAGFTFSINK